MEKTSVFLFFLIFLAYCLFSFSVSLAACKCRCKELKEDQYGPSCGCWLLGTSTVSWSAKAACGISTGNAPPECDYLAGDCEGSYCKYNKCPDVGFDTRDVFVWMEIWKDCWNWGCYCPFVFCEWDDSENKCVKCDNGREVKICGDTSSLYVSTSDDCESAWCTKDGDHQCEYACWADAECDEKDPLTWKDYDWGEDTCKKCYNDCKLHVIDCDDYDSFNEGDYYWRECEVKSWSCTASCSGSDCCDCQSATCNANNECKRFVDLITNEDEAPSNAKCYYDGSSWKWGTPLSSETGSLCCDGYDNDCDGFVDEIDPDCYYDENKDACEGCGFDWREGNYEFGSNGYCCGDDGIDDNWGVNWTEGGTCTGSIPSNYCDQYNSYSSCSADKCCFWTCTEIDPNTGDCMKYECEERSCSGMSESLCTQCQHCTWNPTVKKAVCCQGDYDYIGETDSKVCCESSDCGVCTDQGYANVTAECINYECLCGPCQTNDNCVSGCCERASPPNGPGCNCIEAGIVEKEKGDDCVPVGTVCDCNPAWICISGSPTEWKECNSFNVGEVIEIDEKSFICQEVYGKYMWVETVRTKVKEKNLVFLFSKLFDYLISPLSFLFS